MRRLTTLVLFGTLANSADVTAQSPEAGERVFAQCRACHQVGESARNVTGPHLNGLFSRTSGSVEGYAYTDANRNAGLRWDEASFREYITDPRTKVPGTKMIFAGLKNQNQITDLVAYLKQFDPAGKKP